MTETRRKPGPAPTFDEVEAVDRYAVGDVSLREVGALYGVSAQRIHQAVRRLRPDLGRVTWDSTGTRRFDHQAAIALYAQGRKTMKEVGEVFGVSHVSIHRVIKRHAPHLLEKTRPEPTLREILSREKP